jgi:acetyl-CoA synthetase
MPGVDVQIVDPDTAEPIEKTGEIGEIAVDCSTSPVCFSKYLNKPEATAEKWENGYLLTEDLGFRDADGYFSFHSRKDDVIISSGYRIGPAEVEESLTGHEAVSHAGVIGVPHDDRGQVPKAFVELASGYEDSESLREDLKQHVKERLAKYEYPRMIEVVEEVPKTVTGKIQRSALREAEGIED